MHTFTYFIRYFRTNLKHKLMFFFRKLFLEAQQQQQQQERQKQTGEIFLAGFVNFVFYSR